MAHIAVKILGLGPTVATYLVSENERVVRELEFTIGGRVLNSGPTVFTFESIDKQWWR